MNHHRHLRATVTLWKLLQNSPLPPEILKGRLIGIVCALTGCRYHAARVLVEIAILEASYGPPLRHRTPHLDDLDWDDQFFFKSND